MKGDAAKIEIHFPPVEALADEMRSALAPVLFDVECSLREKMAEAAPKAWEKLDSEGEDWKGANQ